MAKHYGSIRPIAECDSDCAMANGCRMGGVLCEECGRHFCAYELDGGLCADCLEEREAEDGVR